MTATAVWSEADRNGVMRPVHDPAKIPAHLLEHEQVVALQKEVIRLRTKNQHRKLALRDLNLAMTRAKYIEVLNRRYISDIQGINDDLISELRIPKQKNCGCAK